MTSLGSSGGGSLLQVPGALPAISHASLGTGRSSRPKIFLSPSQSIDWHPSHRPGPADGVDGHRSSPTHRMSRHRLSSAHSIDEYRSSPAHRMNRHRLSSTRSMDGYRLDADRRADGPGVERHSSLRLSSAHSAGGRPSQWLGPEDSLDRNKLSPSYVPDSSSVLRRPASFHTASRPLRRQVGHHHRILSSFSYYIIFILLYYIYYICVRRRPCAATLWTRAVRPTTWRTPGPPRLPRRPASGRPVSTR